MPNIIKNAGRISPTPMGDYDTTTTYRRLDCVKYGGTSYICRKNNTVNIPPSDPERWQKIVDEITDMNVEFTEPTQRVAFVSGESLSIIIGKIKKFLSDLSTVAFSGKYSDLSGTPGTVSKTASGLVPQLPDETMTTKYLRQDGTWSIPPDTNTQAVASVNGKTGAVTLNATDVKAFPAAGKINKLTNIGQITRLGYWAISAIDNTYAASIGVDNNTGDFHALVLSYNGNGTNSFNFGTIILSSPRLGAYHYVIRVWEGTAIALKSLNNRNVLNTIEEISANTKSGNVAGALAAKTIMADYNAKINTINSNLGIHLKWCGLPNGNDANNAVNMGVYLTYVSTANCGDWGIILTLTNGDTTIINRWIFQVWLDTKGVIRKRRNINGEGWTTWVEV